LPRPSWFKKRSQGEGENERNKKGEEEREGEGGRATAGHFLATRRRRRLKCVLWYFVIKQQRTIQHKYSSEHRTVTAECIQYYCMGDGSWCYAPPHNGGIMYWIRSALAK